MSGEQHVPTTAAEEASRRWSEHDPALHRWDGLTIDARRSYSVQRRAFEAGASWQREQAVAVRALPDRETIARVIDPESWEESEPHPLVFPDVAMQAEYEVLFWQSVHERREPSLRAADAVLALFGQEGQR